MKRKILSFILAASFVIGGCILPNTTIVQAAEINNSIGTATQMEMNTLTEVKFIGDSDETYYYKVFIPETTENVDVTFTFSNSCTNDVEASVYNETGEIMDYCYISSQDSNYLRFKADGSSYYETSSIDGNITTGKYYYIKLNLGFITIKGSVYTQVSTSPDDNWGGLTTSTEVSLDKLYNGKLEVAGDIDIYKFILPDNGKTYKITATKDNDNNSNDYINIKDAMGSVLYSDQYHDSATWTLTGDGGTYYISFYGQTPTDYSFSIASPKKEKKDQTITTVHIKTYKAKNLKKKASSFSLGAKASGNGKLTYKVLNGGGKVSVSKTGKVTLKKGCKKGSYRITITAASNSEYRAATKTVTVKVQ